MTSNKDCASLGHSHIEMWWNDATDAPEWACESCGQRFVPSDVLEEARYVIKWLFDLTDKDPARQATAGMAAGALRRIEEVLGKP